MDCYISPATALSAAAARSRRGIPIFAVGGWSDLQVVVPTPSSAAGACEAAGEAVGGQEWHAKARWKAKHAGMAAGASY